MKPLHDSLRPTLTRKDAARIINVCERTIINLVASGKLRETRIPSGRGHRSLPRYTQAAIDAYQSSGYDVNGAISRR